MLVPPACFSLFRSQASRLFSRFAAYHKFEKMKNQFKASSMEARTLRYHAISLK